MADRFDAVPLDQGLDEKYVLASHRSIVDQFGVDPLAEGAGRGHRHRRSRPTSPAPKFRPVGPSTTTRPPVMYSHPWSPTPSTTAIGAGVAHAKALPHLAPDEHFAAGCAIEDDVARNDLLLGRERARFWGSNDQASAGESLAEIVIGVTEEAHGDPRWDKGTEALASRADKGQRDRVVGQSLGAVAATDLRTEQRADGAIDVRDGQ